MFLDLDFPRFLAMAALLCAACSSNVVLRRPPAIDTGYLGAYQRCTRDAECKNDTEYDSSKLNDSHTHFYQLPQCPYGVHELEVQNAGASDEIVRVRCAAPDPARANAGTGLPVATAGGRTR